MSVYTRSSLALAAVTAAAIALVFSAWPWPAAAPAAVMFAVVVSAPAWIERGGR